MCETVNTTIVFALCVCILFLFTIYAFIWELWSWFLIRSLFFQNSQWCDKINLWQFSPFKDIKARLDLICTFNIYIFFHSKDAKAWTISPRSVTPKMYFLLHLFPCCTPDSTYIQPLDIATFTQYICQTYGVRKSCRTVVGMCWQEIMRQELTGR